MTTSKSTVQLILLLGSTIALIYGFSPAWSLPDTTFGTDKRLMGETLDLIIDEAHWGWIWLGLVMFVVSRLEYVVRRVQAAINWARA